MVQLREIIPGNAMGMKAELMSALAISVCWRRVFENDLLKQTEGAYSGSTWHIQLLESCQLLASRPVRDVMLCTQPPGQKAEQPEVVTKYGTARGYQFKVDAAERSVNVFLGLPFAKAPVGPLRFSEPQPPEPWKGVRDATSYPPM